jgi:hypothetical protein
MAVRRARDRAIELSSLPPGAPPNVPTITARGSQVLLPLLTARQKPFTQVTDAPKRGSDAF